MVIASDSITLARIDDGVAGRVFDLDCSAIVIKQGKGGELTPSYIDFNSYYRDGAATARKEYAGRFKIEETADGSTWTTIYQSAKDESTVRHSLYTFLTDNDGVPLVDENGYAFAAGREIAEVRCSLYAAGSTTNIIDQQTIPVVIDVEALTHEEIFDLLTNDGKVKGIYKEGDQLYISFTYAKGGQLKLGGVNNINGSMSIFDANGHQIGTWDKDGIHANGGEFSGRIESSSGRIGRFDIGEEGFTSSGENIVSASDIGFLCTGKYSSVWLNDGYIDFGCGYEELIIDDIGRLSMNRLGIYRVTPEGKYEIILDAYGNLHGAGDSPSDERLKNIRHWDDTYDDVLMDLEPIRYTWKNGDENEIHVGVGAQTTQRILEEHGLKDTKIVVEANDRLNVNYQEFHAMEIASIQRNRQLIKSLQEEVQMLKNIILERKGN